MTQQKTTGWGMTPEKQREAAAKATEFEELKGAYTGKIVRAVRGIEKSGAEYVDLSIEINDHIYSMEKIYLFAGKEKNNKPLFGFNLFMGCFGILNLLTGDPVIEDIETDVYDFDTKAFVKKDVPQYKQLINRVVGIVAYTIPKFRNQLIDGYTKRPVSYQVGVDPPVECIWFPDYTDQVAKKYIVVRFFDPKSKMTFAEIQKRQDKKNVVPKELDLLVEKVTSKIFQKPTIPQMDTDAERLVKMNCEKHNYPFNPNLLVSFGKYGGVIPAGNLTGQPDQSSNVSSPVPPVTNDAGIDDDDVPF